MKRSFKKTALGIFSISLFFGLTSCGGGGGGTPPSPSGSYTPYQ